MINSMIGLSITLTSFFVVGYANMIDDNSYLSFYDAIISFYYMIVFVLNTFIIYKGTVHSN